MEIKSRVASGTSGTQRKALRKTVVLRSDMEAYSVGCCFVATVAIFVPYYVKMNAPFSVECVL